MCHTSNLNSILKNLQYNHFPFKMSLKNQQNIIIAWNRFFRILLYVCSFQYPPIQFWFWKAHNTNDVLCDCECYKPHVILPFLPFPSLSFISILIDMVWHNSRILTSIDTNRTFTSSSPTSSTINSLLNSL